MRPANPAKSLLRSITPHTDSPHERFSANLARWIHRHAADFAALRDRRPQVFATLEGKSFDMDRTAPHRIIVGFQDDHDLIGSHLNQITGNGGRAHPFCFAGGADPTKALEITDAFWERYLERGKCAIDPDHNLYGDRYRFQITSEEGERPRRTCQWCGRVQFLHQRTVQLVEQKWGGLAPDEGWQQADEIIAKG